MVLAVLYGLSAATALAIEPTPTPVPAPILTYSKAGSPSATISGGVVNFTIAVTNSGNANSTSQTMRDTLPAGVDWGISADTWGCSLSPSSLPGRTVLSCDARVVIARHLNDTKDAFINGSLSVTVSGVAGACGPLTNVALFNGIQPVFAAIDVVCPATPTPSPTPSPTATTAPTQTPTPTAVATATPTAALATATATAPPTATVPPATATKPPGRAPGPPSTGNSGGSGDSESIALWQLIVSVLLLTGLTFGISWFIRRRFHESA